MSSRFFTILSVLRWIFFEDVHFVSALCPVVFVFFTAKKPPCGGTWGAVGVIHHRLRRGRDLLYTAKRSLPYGNSLAPFFSVCFLLPLAS